ncbi:MAG: radical SAM protein, partial [Armatimonadota bacterium]
MLDTLVLSVTYRCPIKCRYCGAECGPEQTDELSLDEMIELVEHVRSYGQLELVVFTGGEPFLLGDDLRAVVEYCTGLDLKTRIVTNAYWAVTPERAREIVESYVDAGLSEINLSADDYHQEFLPVERIRFANEASSEAGLPCLIGHKVMQGCKLTIER